MNIKFQQFLGRSHSWSFVGQNLARSFISKGHEVDLCSTNGLEFFPEDLKPYLKQENQLKPFYDCQISYTAPTNFPKYLSRGDKNRFGIWCYEWPILPAGFAKYYNFTNKILAPSNFARDIFINNKVPEDRVVTIPHGINVEQYSNKNKYQLKTKASKKILTNIGQPHLRKNISGLFEAYGRAFKKGDDVCLVAKISSKKIEQQFEVDVLKIFHDFKKKYKNHAEVELITEYVPNIVELYNACDIVYTMSYAEGYYMPGIEAIATNKLNIAPRYGGQLDFLNDDNSLLINGKIIRAEQRMQYWNASVHNTCFDADIDDAVLKLRKAVNEYDTLMDRFNKNVKPINEYSWDSVTDKIMGLVV